MNPPCEFTFFVLQQQQNLWRRFGTSKIHFSPQVALAAVRSKAVVLLLLIVTPIVGFCNCSMFCCALLCLHSSFAIISRGKRDLVALLCLSSWCLVVIVWLFLMMTLVCLQFVIVTFPGHTHYFHIFFIFWPLYSSLSLPLLTSLALSFRLCFTS